MSTVLIYTSPARGHLYPIMDVALALQETGHSVAVQTLADEGDQVRSQGLEHRAIAPAIESLELEDYQAGSPPQQLRSTLQCWYARAEHEVRDVRSAIAELHPDLLLVDANTWGAAAVAAAQQRPWAMFLPYCLPLPSPDTPAFGPGFPPPRTRWHRLRDRAVWAAQSHLAQPVLRRLNALRGDLGVPGVRRVSDLYLQADVLLYRTAEPFEYPRRHWPDSVHAIGPGLWAPPGEAPGWLADLPRPRVLVSVSTEPQQDGAIVSAAIAGLSGEPGSVIVTTAALDPDGFAAPHDRVRLTRFLPHAAVIPHVDVVVTHGGMGTTQRALAAGVPVCAVPWGRDQHESARRAEQCGAGVILSRGALTPDTLRDAVREARGRTAAAARVAEGFAVAGGSARAVELLEGLPSTTGGTPARG
jgi:MGT family glycosyltransferase